LGDGSELSKSSSGDSSLPFPSPKNAPSLIGSSGDANTANANLSAYSGTNTKISSLGTLNLNSYNSSDVINAKNSQINSTAGQNQTITSQGNQVSSINNPLAYSTSSADPKATAKGTSNISSTKSPSIFKDFLFNYKLINL